MGSSSSACNAQYQPEAFMGFTNQTDQHLVHNHPGIVYVDILQKHCFLIEIAIPGDSQIAQKAAEKLERYTDLKIEIRKMWSLELP